MLVNFSYILYDLEAYFVFRSFGIRTLFVAPLSRVLRILMLDFFRTRTKTDAVASIDNL